MPTGYTAAVQDGKITALEDFVWQCARNMGALIMMRDEPHGTPVPRRFEPSTSYHDVAISIAAARLAELKAMGPLEVKEAAGQWHANAVREWMGSEDRRTKHRLRYHTMLSKVRAWTPPTPDHVGLQEFMIEQLETSIDFDCRGRRREQPVALSPDAWRAEELDRAARSFAYHTEERAAEIARTESRNRWIADLRASLDGARA